MFESSCTVRKASSGHIGPCADDIARTPTRGRRRLWDDDGVFWLFILIKKQRRLLAYLGVWELV
ncbi:hypothetical protein IFM47457_05548 [Aspergillus lentulus]|nr:hypothetical protein IFM47457_05548 [Aspergillus lentulus]